MLVQPDFSEVLEGVPPGTYQAVLVDSEMRDSKAGSKYVRWRMTIQGANDTRVNGQSVWTNTPVAGKGAFRLQQLYKAATQGKLTGGFDTSELMGKVVTIDVIDQIDNSTGEKTGFVDVKNVRAVK